MVFTGDLTSKKYKDPKSEGYREGGHWAVDKSGVDGNPRHVYIETFQQQKEFCKRNGLVNPKDIGPMDAASDGKKSSSTGLPGAWI